MMGTQVFRMATSKSNESSGISSTDALRMYSSVLTMYEKVEILQYATVYCTGERARKIHAVEGLPHNGGYDDKDSRYMAKKYDHVAYRYEILSGLGKGAFGDVYKTFDHKTQKEVALKMIRNEKRFHRQAKTEVKVLDMLRAQDANDSNCCVHMLDYFTFRGHLCITFDMHHNDLYTELKQGGFVGFDTSNVRDVAQSTLRCLSLLYNNHIVHTDLKPENMLLESNSSQRVKVIDFGSACFVHEKAHTYIQSRYYRSPEIMLGMGYGTAIDMWSLGCILVELATGSPLFPAKTEYELITLHTELLGVPPKYLLDRATRTHQFFEKTSSKYTPLRYSDRKGRRRSPNGLSMAAACQSSDAEFIDFISRCLTWDPANRMTPQEALQHPYITTPIRCQQNQTLRRSFSEDGLVAMLTNQSQNLTAMQSKSGSNKSLNDSGVSSEFSDTSDGGSADDANN
eukprot:m.98354 g.98354  ORF g.98354 m.98354 type:complete len:456 (+) comp16744_c0_seq1:284-1651(+)